MGAQGIRRRKRRHDLPEAHGLPRGDADRVFGRFTWGAYSPAGGLERNGFFWRQVKRRDPGDPIRIVAFGLWGLRVIALSVFVLAPLVGFVWWLVR